ncbi:MAG: 7-carboxy-7-deazaguanine synthase QueE [Cyanobacteriota bacterium]|nr:7-carboxy-7-deazaguanine synthase QueE [Cyanobacteriota bacterium]
MSAKLIEVFSAIQGEGLNVGTRQIFVRFAGCDLRCSFCDSAHTWITPDTCRIEGNPGLRDFTIRSNPVGIEDLLAWVEQLDRPQLHDSISITGGEPLLHAPFLAEFLPQVRQRTGLPIYLETAGHRPQQLASILSDLDLVGMDIKLPSVSGETWWSEHDRFLRLCRDSQLQVFVKLIASDLTRSEELEKAARLVANVSEKIPVFLQPVSALSPELRQKNQDLRTIEPKVSVADSERSPTPEKVLAWQALMKHWIESVRVVPQTHKMLDQL